VRADRRRDREQRHERRSGLYRHRLPVFVLSDERRHAGALPGERAATVAQMSFCGCFRALCFFPSLLPWV
jgi:hypothetical protein